MILVIYYLKTAILKMGFIFFERMFIATVRILIQVKSITLGQMKIVQLILPNTSSYNILNELTAQHRKEIPCKSSSNGATSCVLLFMSNERIIT